MPYHVEIDEVFVLDYLENPDRSLSVEDIEVLLGVIEGFATTGETYRNDSSRRYPPGSDQFQVTYLFLDSAGKYRLFRFIISDAAVVYGVLRVCFAVIVHTLG
jgi:hypothetical protein